MRVFVLDKNLKPLDPCAPARARELLPKGRAKVFKCYPFTIALQERTVVDSVTHPHRIKIDPGSKTTLDCGCSRRDWTCHQRLRNIARPDSKLKTP
jgi:hypothetical protein